MKKIYLLFFAGMILFSCKQGSRSAEPKAETTGERQNFKTQNEVDDEIIKKYVAEKKLNGKFISGGIYAVISDSGKGESPTDKNKVTVNYKGYFLNGNVFDQSGDKGFSFMYNGVIQGWGICASTLKRGGKGTFIIPSYLAYGDRGSPPVIPANAVLAFDIELIDFN